MNFELDVDLAKRFISIILDVIPQGSGSSIPILLETKEEGAISALVLGGSACGIVSVQADVFSEGSVIVDFSVLNKVVSGFVVKKTSSYITSKLNFSKNQDLLRVKSTITYDSGKVKNNRTISILDLPIYRPKISQSKNPIRVPSDILSEAFAKIAPAISILADQYSGVSLRLSGDSLAATSMNGVSLVEYKSVANLALDEEVSCILPVDFSSKFGRLLSKLDKEEGASDVFLSIKKSEFVFSYDPVLCKVSTSRVGFPDYSDILSKVDKEVIISKEMLSDNIRNILFSSNADDDNRISFHFEAGELLVYSDSCDNSGIPVKGLTGLFDIDFNGVLFDKHLSNIDTEEVSLSFKTRKDPVLLKPVGEVYDLISVVAPLQ